MTKKLDVIGAIVFTAILAFGLGLQVAQPWTGSTNTLSDGCMEVDEVNITTGIYWNDENRTDTIANPEQIASYTIFLEGTIYYAKNGTTGQIEYSGTNVTLIIENIKTVLSNIGTIYLKEVQKPAVVVVPDTLLIIECYQGNETLYWGSRVFYPTLPKEHAIYQLRTERYAEDYELISDFETIGDWVLGGGESLVNDTDNFKEGNQGIKFTSINNVATFADRTINLNALGKRFEIWMYIEGVENLVADNFYISFRGPPHDWSNYFRFVEYSTDENNLANGWNRLVLSRAEFWYVGSVEADWGDIDMARISIKSEPGTTVNCTFDDFRMVSNRFAGKVTLRFDDGLDNTYTEARPRMDEYGFRGVIAPHISGIDTSGHVSTDQLKHLQERGWDIVSHTMTHKNLPTLSVAELEEELWNSQRWLIENGFYKGSRFIILPGHSWNPNVIEYVKKYYAGCQTLGWLSDSIPPVSPHRMNTRLTISSTTPLATIQGVIDEAVVCDSWITLLFHGISDMLVLFQNTIDYIDASGLEVITFSDVFDDQVVAHMYQNEGTQTCADNEDIAHELAETPTFVSITPMNDTYDSVPVISTVDWSNVNSTHIRVGLYWINGTAISDDIILVSWRAKYDP